MILKVVRSLSKWLLIGMGVGALLVSAPQVARGQSVNREAIRELNLSRSQMRELCNVMRSYQSEMQGILTAEQLEQLEDLQAERKESPDTDESVDLAAELNLSEEQTSQFEALQEDIAAEFQTILSAEQLEQAEELGLPGL